MFEKVNPSHPDKVADRIAGALVDLAYKKEKRPTIAVEVLIGHGAAFVIVETSAHFFKREVEAIVKRIAGEKIRLYYIERQQDKRLANNQQEKIRCGDNGIFKGEPITKEQTTLTLIAHRLFDKYKTDGKYILDDGSLIICQSNAEAKDIAQIYSDATINPIGSWTGGTDVDAGATNRKLGSDMGGAVTGGGLHGKDLSKADVSVNIYAHLKAQQTGEPVEISCAIGDEAVDGRPYSEVVEIAREYIYQVGGFEKFAEWGLIR